MNYEHKVCTECGQKLTYELEMDRGTVEILKAIARFIKEKGINAVHLSKEMLKDGHLTHHQVGNISRPRFHGLVAKVAGKTGNYCLTDKGLSFLKGEPIPRTAIIAKSTETMPARTVAHGMEIITIKEVDNEWHDYWSSNGYTIEAGRVITEPPVKRPVPMFGGYDEIKHLRPDGRRR